MCGIIGMLGEGPAAPRLVAALKRLEYRGYDSAGVAVIGGAGVQRQRASGKIVNLEAALAAAPLDGSGGIGHTRWATHGLPTENNAHPHVSGGVTIVHNGIIENFRLLRDEMRAAGRTFVTETDSEVIAHLIAANVEAGLAPLEATKAALSKMRGAYAIAVLFDGHPDLMIGARKGSPLVIGLGENENFLGSDAIAVAPFTDKIVYLEEGDIALLTRKRVIIYDSRGAVANRPMQLAQAAAAAVDKGGYRHFMLKEIYEQPETIGRTISHYADALTESVRAPDLQKVDFQKLKRLHIVGCGTAHYAGRVAEYWFERIAGLPIECDIASEFRYREPALLDGEAALFVSQSGETADVLAALQLCKAKAMPTIGVINVASSSIARECSLALPTLAGPEIAVASTKAFTAQLAALAALAVHAGRARGRLDAAAEAKLVHALFSTPGLFSRALTAEPQIHSIAQGFAEARNVLFFGRGSMYPLALEGALKLKEISYIHAEGYAAGELKHGPIALVDEHTPIVMLAPHDALFEKSLSNLEEVAARKGRVLLISDQAGLDAAGDAPWAKIAAPECDALNAPIVYAALIQLLAYHVATIKGTDVDQPRNLAKSVTVE